MWYLLPVYKSTQLGNLTRLQVVIVIISVHILFDFPAIFQIHAVTILPGKGNESELFIQPGGMANIYFSV